MSCVSLDMDQDKTFVFFMDIKINNDNKKKMEGLKIKKQDEIKIFFL